MTFRILSGIEAGLQMAVIIVGYMNCCGECEGSGRRMRKLLYPALFLLFAAEVCARRGLLISVGSVPLFIAAEAIWLRCRTGNGLRTAFTWTFFMRWTMALLEMPALIFSSMRNGIFEGMNANLYPDSRAKWMQCLMMAAFAGICFWKRKMLLRSAGDILKSKRSLLVVLGGIEVILIFYLMNLTWDVSGETDFFLSALVIVSVFLFLILQMAWMQYEKLEAVNRMYLQRERSLEKAYALIGQEMECSRRVSHDYKYDLAYLYDCLRERDYERGIAHLEEKIRIGKERSEGTIWTGFGCVDFLLNQAKMRAERENIGFSASIRFTHLPAAEYEFFSALGNLLDNAFEAAVRCDEGERKIRVKLATNNHMFMLRVENRYKEEPQEDDGRFKSTKGDGDNHGWGLVNVKEIVERTGGILKLDYGNGMFCAKAVWGAGETAYEIHTGKRRTKTIQDARRQLGKNRTNSGMGMIE